MIKKYKPIIIGNNINAKVLSNKEKKNGKFSKVMILK